MPGRSDPIIGAVLLWTGLLSIDSMAPKKADGGEFGLGSDSDDEAPAKPVKAKASKAKENKKPADDNAKAAKEKKKTKTEVLAAFAKPKAKPAVKEVKEKAPAKAKGGFGLGKEKPPSKPPSKAPSVKLSKAEKKEAAAEAKKAEVVQSLEQHGYTAVVRAYDSTTVAQIIDRYVKGGLKVLEISSSCPGVYSFVRQIRKNVPDVLVGVGTCLTVTQCKNAVTAGAQFVVSPVFNEEVVREAVRLKTPMMPGCATAAEMKRANSLGCPMLKLFKESTMPVVITSIGRAAEPCSCDVKLEDLGGSKKGSFFGGSKAGSVTSKASSKSSRMSSIMSNEE